MLLHEGHLDFVVVGGFGLAVLAVMALVKGNVPAMASVMSPSAVEIHRAPEEDLEADLFRICQRVFKRGINPASCSHAQRRAQKARKKRGRTGPKRKDYDLPAGSFAERLMAAIDERGFSDSEASVLADLNREFVRDCYRDPQQSPSIAHVAALAKSSCQAEWLAWGVERKPKAASPPA
jgi:hypothetical protein